MHRRDFITLACGVTAAWPLAARAQPSKKPVIGFLSARSAEESARLVDAFRNGLAEYGMIEGKTSPSTTVGQTVITKGSLDRPPTCWPDNPRY